eukprot:TRINITY_DN29019_c0_g1_i1.p1 TRINITY_DN29019_c0_g1~~TRINITY_DN29019_c0_g1_i1.p1  ORF type:complete len:514 (-),score=124.37 TRINITY_DN29019_c0_g1_i1:130-1671(-)
MALPLPRGRRHHTMSHPSLPTNIALEWDLSSADGSPRKERAVSRVSSVGRMQKRMPSYASTCEPMSRQSSQWSCRTTGDDEDGTKAIVHSVNLLRGGPMSRRPSSASNSRPQSPAPLPPSGGLQNVTGHRPPRGVPFAGANPLGDAGDAMARLPSRNGSEAGDRRAGSRRPKTFCVSDLRQGSKNVGFDIMRLPSDSRQGSKHSGGVFSRQSSRSGESMSRAGSKRVDVPDTDNFHAASSDGMATRARTLTHEELEQRVEKTVEYFQDAQAINQQRIPLDKASDLLAEAKARRSASKTAASRAAEDAKLSPEELRAARLNKIMQSASSDANGRPSSAAMAAAKARHDSKDHNEEAPRAGSKAKDLLRTQLRTKSKELRGASKESSGAAPAAKDDLHSKEVQDIASTEEAKAAEEVQQSGDNDQAAASSEAEAPKAEPPKKKGIDLTALWSAKPQSNWVKAATVVKAVAAFKKPITTSGSIAEGVRVGSNVMALINKKKEQEKASASAAAEKDA